jgi:hypothetical protein
MVAAVTDIDERPGTTSSSTALRPICDAARWTMAGNPKIKLMG